MLRVGFIFPSQEYLFDPFRGDPFTHYQILTVLEDRFGPRITPLLIDLRGIKKEFAIYHIPECDVYLHSVYTLDYEEQCDLVRKLKIRYPRAIHIAGGPHANTFTEESLHTFDTVILGEGEEETIQAINDTVEGRRQLVYENRGPVDINAYPYPRRHFLPKSATARKRMMNLKTRPGFEELYGTCAIFSRGCPYNCHFCALHYARRATPGIRYRSPENVEAEIEYLKREFGVQGLSLADEIVFPLNRRDALRHLEAIGRTNIFWRGQCRVDGVTPEIARLARESGCVALGLGVESVVQQCLDIINKRITVEKARETIALLKKTQIEARVYIILGLPGEPEDIVERTWTFIEEVQPDLVFLSLFTIRPGTEVFTNPERFGIKHISADWKKTMHMYGRFSEEIPVLTFEYCETTPWGPSIPPEKIVQNYLELQKRLKERGLASV